MPPPGLPPGVSWGVFAGGSAFQEASPPRHPPERPPEGRLEQPPLPSSIPVCAPRPPRVALRLPSGAPPSGLGVSPRTHVRGPLGTPTVGARRYWWPLVASAVGICGLLTVGYPSIADSGGYGRCGFRLMGVPRRSASAWSSMCQPRSAPRGAPRVPVADLALGNTVGAIGMAPGALPVRRRRPRRVGCVSHPFHDIPAPPLSGGGGRASSGARARVVSG